MRPWSWCAVLCFICVYLYAQAAVDAGDEPQVFWLKEKPEDPQFEPHAGFKMVQVRGSLVYICEWHTPTLFNHM